MKHYRTADLLIAVQELARDHSAKYARDCIRSALRAGVITLAQYRTAMRILSKAA